MVNKNGDIKEINHYYPFGGIFASEEDGSSNSIANGPEVLVKLTGEAAQEYNEEKISRNDVKSFIITDISDDNLVKTLDEKFNSSTKSPMNPNSEYYNSPMAHIVDEYNIINNNCATTVSTALNTAGSKVLKGSIQQPSRNFGMWQNVQVLRVYNTPMGIQNHMKGLYHSK